MATVKIAIIGAGPAGCTLARILTQSSQSIEVTVFEAEASATARPNQTGRVHLHTNTGLAAIARANLTTQYHAHARFDAESIIVTDKTLRRYIDLHAKERSPKKARPEIDRETLRDLLVESLPEGMIKWNHHLRHIDRELNLHFEHATVSGFDLVVGADGAWSQVRSLVSTTYPFYSDIGGVQMRISDVEMACPGLHKLVRKGSVFAYSDHKFLSLQQLGDGSMSVSCWSQRPQSWTKELGFPTSDADALKAWVKADFADWDPRLVRAIDAADVDVSVSDIYMLPIGHSWKHRPGVTLIGDSAHLMPPIAGEGVNIAMEDAMHLARAITDAAERLHGSADDAEAKRTVLSRRVADFEKHMFKRAKKTQKLTFDFQKLLFMGPGAFDKIAEKYACKTLDANVHWKLAPILKPWVYAYYFLFRLLHLGY